MKRLQKRIGVVQPITEMFSNDPRLDDLAAWTPESNVCGAKRRMRRKLHRRRYGRSHDS